MSNIFSMIATIGAGRQQAASYKAQKLGAEIEQKMALLRGTQIGERSREDLATALGNIDAIRVGRGVSLDSATGEAIRKRTRKDAYRDEAVARLAEWNRSGNAAMAARGYGQAARWAVPMSVLQVASTAAEDAGRAYAAGMG